MIYDTPQWAAIKDFFNEPDFLNSEEAGLKICLRRNHSKAWCGYVGVPKEHPLFQKDYSYRVPVLSRGTIEIKQQSPIALFREALTEDDGCVALDVFLDCPGGLTYSGFKWPEDDGLWYLGFDCSHYNDLSPRQVFESFAGGIWRLGNEVTYRNITFVEQATRKLAQQIQAVFKA